MNHPQIWQKRGNLEITGGKGFSFALNQVTAALYWLKEKYLKKCLVWDETGHHLSPGKVIH